MFPLGHFYLSIFKFTDFFSSIVFRLFLFFPCFFVSLIIFEWAIGIECGRTVETEVINIHSWKWLGLFLSV